MASAEGEHAGIHYIWSEGAPGPALVLINSLGSDLRMWNRVVPAWEARRRLLRFDMPGHGPSVPRPGPYSIAQLGDIVVSLADQLDLRQVDVCGASLGGLVALWLGIHAPERVRRLVLANAAAHFGTHTGWEQRIAEVRAAGMEVQARAALGRWFTPAFREQHPGDMEFIRAMIASTDAESYAACCAALRDTDLHGELSAITAPCLVITGTHDGAATPQQGREVAAALGDARVVELDASHLSAWERSDEFAQAVLAFLDEEQESHHG